MNTLVTIGVPTYNRPQGLDKLLTCIHQQTYKNLEILISDNNSPDPAVTAVIEKYKALDHRIFSTRQIENIGVENNFNFVLNQAKGEYFMWEVIFFSRRRFIFAG